MGERLSFKSVPAKLPGLITISIGLNIFSPKWETHLRSIQRVRKKKADLGKWIVKYWARSKNVNVVSIKDWIWSWIDIVLGLVFEWEWESILLGCHFVRRVILAAKVWS